MKDETFLKDVINNDNERLKVRKTLQLQKQSCDHIFALGDCADNAPQFAYLAAEQAKVVAHNIITLSKGETKELKEYAIGMSVIVLPLGNANGVSQLPGAMVFGGKVTSNLKGKTLFYARYWKELGLENVPHDGMLYCDDPVISLKDTYLNPETLARFVEKTGLTRSELAQLIFADWQNDQPDGKTETKAETTTEDDSKTQ